MRRILRDVSKHLLRDQLLKVLVGFEDFVGTRLTLGRLQIRTVREELHSLFVQTRIGGHAQNMQNGSRKQIMHHFNFVRLAYLD